MIVNLVKIANFLWIQSWQIIVLFVVIVLITLTIKNKSAHIRYLLWLIVLIKCLVPPVLTIPFAIFPEDKNPESFGIPLAQISTIVTHEPNIRTYHSQPIQSVNIQPRVTVDRPTSLYARTFLFFIWIIGISFFIFAVLVKFVKINRMLRRKRKQTPPQLQRWITDIISSLNVKSLPKVWMIEEISQPFVWGVIRGSVYLPDNFNHFADYKDCRNVFMHELCHVLRHDVAVNFIQLMIQAIYWFHPFVWWANRKLRQEREKCCDEMAIARLKALPQDYGTAILKTLNNSSELIQLNPTLAITDSIRNIATRIKIIMKPGKKFYKRPSQAAVLMSLFLAALFIPTAMALTEKTENNLKVLDIKFEPIQRGKNFVEVKVENISSQEQIFGIFIHTSSPDMGRDVTWCGLFFDTFRPNDTKWSRFSFRIVGPASKNTKLILTFYNLYSSEIIDLKKYFDRKRYSGKDWEHLTGNE